jgi:hypothetical protein
MLARRRTLPVLAGRTKSDQAMAAVTEYTGIIKRLLSGYAEVKPSVGEIEVELIFDDERRHYELMQSGWIGLHRVHGSVIHIDLRDDKVWIQHDGTREHVAERLMEAGIPQDHIVLGFHAPYKRPLTPFATG